MKVNTDISGELRNEYIRHILIIREKIINSQISSSNFAVLDGKMSSIIFLDTLEKSNLNIVSDNSIEQLFSEIIDKVSQTSLVPNLVSGIKGFAHGMSFFLQKNDEIKFENEFLSFFDNMIIKHTLNEIKSDNFDYFYGSLGGINYLTQRALGEPTIKDELVMLVKFFLEKRNNYNVFWKDNNMEDDKLDLSISHGQSAIIHTFTKLIELDVLSNELTKVVYSMVNKILTFIDGDRIPDFFDVENTPQYSPLRWCHGELGIINSLVSFADIHNDNRIKDRLLPVALKMAKFKTLNSGDYLSATICHGTLGVANLFHLFKKHYLANDAIINASDYWYQNSIDILNSDINYKYNNSENYHVEKSGVLYGIEGIGLALLSKLDEKSSDWNKFILLK